MTRLSSDVASAWTEKTAQRLANEVVMEVRANATKTNEVVVSDSHPVFLAENTGLAFVGSVLKLDSLKAAATDFKFIEALADEVPLLRLPRRFDCNDTAYKVK